MLIYSFRVLKGKTPSESLWSCVVLPFQFQTSVHSWNMVWAVCH